MLTCMRCIISGTALYFDQNHDAEVCQSFTYAMAQVMHIGNHEKLCGFYGNMYRQHASIEVGVSHTSADLMLRVITQPSSKQNSSVVHACALLN